MPKSEQAEALKESLSHHRPSADFIPIIESLREAAIAYGSVLSTLVPGCPQRDIAETRLEESLMWAIKAVILNEVKEGTTQDEPSDDFGDISSISYHKDAVKGAKWLLTYNDDRNGAAFETFDEVIHYISNLYRGAPPEGDM